MQNPTLYARPLEPGQNYVGFLFAGDVLNPEIPASLRQALEELWRRHSIAEDAKENAWEKVFDLLAPPGKELGGYRTFIRLRTSRRPRVAGFVGGGELGPESDKWWEEYGLVLPEDQQVDKPGWLELKLLRIELDKAAALYFRRHLAVYQGEDGIYARAMLDLGDRPLEVLLYESGFLNIEVPLHTELPDTRRARNYVLEELAFRYAQYNLRIDGRAILVMRFAGRYSVDGLAKNLQVFIEDASLAATDLRKHLDARRAKEILPRSGRQRVHPCPSSKQTPCISVYTNEDGRIFTGPLLDEDSVFNLDIPKEPLRYIIGSWGGHCAFYKGSKENFIKEYLMRRMPTSLGLAYRGYSVRLFCADGECKEE